MNDDLLAGRGVLIAPNHAAFADPYLLLDAAERVGTGLFFMTAWQVFGTRSRFHQLVLQQHGCFSVDREGTDLTAFKQAVALLAERAEPLVIFPEGELYHTSDRVTPFRPGFVPVANAVPLTSVVLM